MTIDLRYADDVYDSVDAAPAGGGSARLPDGTYQCWVHSAEITEEGFQGRKLDFPVLRINFRELAPSNGLATLTQQIHPDPKRMAFLKRLLAQLWPAPAPRPSEMEGRLGELLERCYEIKVVTKPSGDRTYTNVYVNRYLDGVQPPEVDDEGNRLPF